MHLSFPSPTIAILSARASASSMAWVVKTTVFSFFNSLMRLQTDLLDTGSMPVVGSSRKMTLGFPMTLMATESRLFIPPEKVNTRASLTSSRPTSSSSWIEFFIIMLGCTPFILLNIIICSIAVSWSHRMSNWGTRPMILLILSCSYLMS
mmetsp:Transcript_6217/g.10563  ORF Transcript_6217/g.10563 Transcript_6217/m.10563 type:complete len:150 (+) Transcript_6217:412-861(+)